MTTYKLLYDDNGVAKTIVLTRDDGSTTSFPNDPENYNYAGYAAWLAEGNTPNPYEPPPSVVPETIALWQARAILSKKGLLANADAAVKNSQDEVLQSIWEYGNYVIRSSAGIASLAAAMGLSDAEVDELFIEAAALSG